MPSFGYAVTLAGRGPASGRRGWVQGGEVRKREWGRGHLGRLAARDEVVLADVLALAMRSSWTVLLDRLPPDDLVHPHP